MKQSKKVFTKITAIFLSAICVTSIATATLPSVSAASSTNAIISTGLDKIKEYNDSIRCVFAAELKSLMKYFPYGTIALDVFLDILSFNLEDTETNPQFDEIIEKLDKVQDTLNDISIDMKLSKNESFDKSIDRLQISVESGFSALNKYYSELENLVKTQKKLDEANEKLATLTDADEIAKQKEIIESLTKSVNKYKSSVSKKKTEALNVIERENLKDKLLNAKAELIHKTVSQTSEQPFINYFDGVIKERTVKYGEEAYKKSQIYEQTVMSVYTSAISLYSAITKFQVNDYMTNGDTDEAELVLEDLDDLLIGVHEATYYDSETKTTNNVWKDSSLQGTHLNQISDEYKTSKKFKDSLYYAYAYYESVIVPYEQEKKLDYYYKEDSCITLNSIQKCELMNGILNTLSSVTDQKMLDSYTKINRDNDTYIGEINKIISDDYIAKHNNIKLRTFLKNLGYEAPEDAKYLVCGQCVKEHDWGIGGYYYKMPVIALDNTNAHIEYKTYKTYTENNKSTVYKTYSDLCYFLSNPTSKSTIVAEVTPADGNKKPISYSSFAEAWQKVISKGGTIKFLTDWVAQKYGEENFTRFAETDITGFRNGALFIYGDENNVYKTITIDLNGHNLDRHQDTAVNDGSVIIMGTGYAFINLHIINSSNKQASITGGNTTGNGGGVCDENKNINMNKRFEFQNIMIIRNHADGYGGGIYASECNSDCLIANASIIHNTASKNGGGLFARVSGLYASTVTLYGDVNISNNTVNNRDNNATLDSNAWRKSTFHIRGDWDHFKNSYIGVSSTTGQSSIDITQGYEELKDCDGIFYADTKGNINIYKGFGFWTKSSYVELTDM